MTARTTSPHSQIEWQCKPFGELTPHELYALMQLRMRVFVVEQHCVYLDLDDVDQLCHHLLGWVPADTGKRLIAYARLIPPGVKYDEPSIGRVITHGDARGTGAGQSLMHEAIRRVEGEGWGSSICIAAQMYLERFYEGFGFTRAGAPYTEDDIWHVEMRRD